MTAPGKPSTTLVLLNPMAHAGQGRRLYKQIEPYLGKHGAVQIVESDRQGLWQNEISNALERGIRIFLAAGGDGTVRALVEQLFRVKGALKASDITIGGIGLGSSNDYHKPFSHIEANIPLKIDPCKPRRRDICRAQIVRPDGKKEERFFTVSASVGFTAQGNRFFNSDDRLLLWLKKRYTTLAIAYAAVRTFLRYQPLCATLEIADNTLETTISNLSLLKTPFISGTFRVDTPSASDDGLLGIHLSQTNNRFGLLRQLWDLSRGRFLGRANRQFWQAPTLTVKTDHPVSVELDGEIFEANQVVFEVLDDWIKECL